jgi:toxin YoeB
VNLVFAPQAWEDYLYWQENDPQMISRINLLIKEIARNPYSGIGKPEPLKHALQGLWSRRITSEHRIVYRKAGGDEILIAQLRYHYR